MWKCLNNSSAEQHVTTIIGLATVEAKLTRMVSDTLPIQRTKEWRKDSDIDASLSYFNLVHCLVFLWSTFVATAHVIIHIQI